MFSALTNAVSVPISEFCTSARLPENSGNEQHNYALEQPCAQLAIVCGCLKRRLLVFFLPKKSSDLSQGLTGVSEVFNLAGQRFYIRHKRGV